MWAVAVGGLVGRTWAIASGGELRLCEVTEGDVRPWEVAAEGGLVRPEANIAGLFLP